MVADDVGVVLEMVEHLLIRPLAMTQAEAMLDLNRVTRPVQRRRLPQQRPSAAVEQALDDLVLRVIVWRLGIFVHVKAGIAADTALQVRVLWLRQTPHGE